MRGVGLAILAIALIGTIGQSAGMIHRSLDPMNRIFLGAALSGLSLVIWLRAGRRVIIDGDSIQVTGCSRRGRCAATRFSAGTCGAGTTYFYVIVPRDRSRGELRLPPFLKTDKLFHDWMHSIPKIRE